MMPQADGRKSRSWRPGKCACCELPGDQLARLEALKVGGASLDSLAEMFGVSRDSIFRHYKSHTSDKRKAELLMCGGAEIENLSLAAAKESKSLLEYLAIVRSVLFSQFMARAEAGDSYGVSVTASRLLEALRDLGRLSGELRQLSGLTINNTVTNVYADPDFLALQEFLIVLARKYPVVRDEVLGSLQVASPTTPVGPNVNTYPSAQMIEHEAVDAA